GIGKLPCKLQPAASVCRGSGLACGPSGRLLPAAGKNPSFLGVDSPSGGGDGGCLELFPVLPCQRAGKRCAAGGASLSGFVLCRWLYVPGFLFPGRSPA